MNWENAQVINDRCSALAYDDESRRILMASESLIGRRAMFASRITSNANKAYLTADDAGAFADYITESMIWCMRTAGALGIDIGALMMQKGI